MISGTAAPGYEAVKEQFTENFTSRKEVGAACAVTVDGELVVDLWGGSADPKTKRPWRADTMVNVFSTTKGVSSLALAHAHSHGLFDYEAKVASYWPEFSANGKEDVTVRQLLSHQAGLSAIDASMDIDTLADPDLVAAAIAAQEPAWTPGTMHGYHGISLGWYESELLRRVDPQHVRLVNTSQTKSQRHLVSSSTSVFQMTFRTTASPRSWEIGTEQRWCSTSRSSRVPS
jgi:CubicO group peptidase (beta-lactamase class C family)